MNKVTKIAALFMALCVSASAVALTGCEDTSGGDTTSKLDSSSKVDTSSVKEIYYLNFIFIHYSNYTFSHNHFIYFYV